MVNRDYHHLPTVIYEIGVTPQTAPSPYLPFALPPILFIFPIGFELSATT